MLAERTVFRRTFRVTPMALWVVQRASGVLLGPLVALHILLPGLASNGVLNALLLAVVLAHGYGGIQRMAAAKPKNALCMLGAVAWTMAVGLFGLLIVSAGN